MRFLDPPNLSERARVLFDEDVSDMGYVMNGTMLWAYQPDTMAGLFDLMRQSIAGQRLGVRERGILITALASTFGDSYCSLAWGQKLAAAGVLLGHDEGLTDREQAMAGWGRQVARDPNRVGAADVQQLRDAGYDDAAVFVIAVFAALRIAFSTVNDALGPDRTRHWPRPSPMRSEPPSPTAERPTIGPPRCILSCEVLPAGMETALRWGCDPRSRSTRAWRRGRPAPTVAEDSDLRMADPAARGAPA
ncbi:carboxymuconolactone decarboxylase family protein [Actinoplanes derwentensis]|uniref:Alkylhydroperoxidase family enzyme, contains CxxC motif n=1 Tax=Actinoplanes derwentensis TaxID=113562 RepID=A0A1H1T5U0_9ACTN|nr:hypothetical protein [Actinoplanes derwentensis]GID88990.1 hypothetical protein Ade03nite_79140 [Actinoplanes derwentensis]SDS55548.1 hypothetical protein SAMN04489716_1044 [Actinoplanes derwentensis]